MNVNREIQLKYDQILVLVKKDFKVKYNATAIGFFWSLLIPLCMSLTYYFIFGVMMRWNAHNYLLYLLTGNFFWQFFSSVVLVNGTVLMSNAALLKKTSFRHELLLWATFFAEGIHFLLTLAVLFIAMLYYRVTPQWLNGLCNFAFLLVFFPTFALGVSYLYAALNIYFRDLERIMSVLMMLWCFVSPIFIPIAQVPKQYLFIYDINPMAGFIGVFRDIFYEPGLHPGQWLLPALSGIICLLLGRWFFHRMSPGFAEKI